MQFALYVYYSTTAWNWFMPDISTGIIVPLFSPVLHEKQVREESNRYLKLSSHSPASCSLVFGCKKSHRRGRKKNQINLSNIYECMNACAGLCEVAARRLKKDVFAPAFRIDILWPWPFWRSRSEKKSFACRIRESENNKAAASVRSALRVRKFRAVVLCVSDFGR